MFALSMKWFFIFLHIAEKWVGPINMWKKEHTGDEEFSRGKIDQVNAEILLVKPTRGRWLNILPKLELQVKHEWWWKTLEIHIRKDQKLSAYQKLRKITRNPPEMIPKSWIYMDTHIHNLWELIGLRSRPKIKNPRQISQNFETTSPGPQNLKISSKTIEKQWR